MRAAEARFKTAEAIGQQHKKEEAFNIKSRTSSVLPGDREKLYLLPPDIEAVGRGTYELRERAFLRIPPRLLSTMTMYGCVSGC